MTISLPPAYLPDGGKRRGREYTGKNREIKNTPWINLSLERRLKNREPIKTTKKKEKDSKKMVVVI